MYAGYQQHDIAYFATTFLEKLYLQINNVIEFKLSVAKSLWI